MEEYPFDLLHLGGDVEDPKTEKKKQEQTAIKFDGERKDCIGGTRNRCRKRKREQVNPQIIDRNIKPMFLFQKALLNEPKLSENSVLLHSWAEFLSNMGPGVTVSELRSRINKVDTKSPVVKASAPETPARACSKIESGDFVWLFNKRWEKMGSGKVIQTEGKWHGIVNGTLDIEDAGLCIVKLKERCFSILPYPSESGGRTVSEAPQKSIIAWDADKIITASRATVQ